MSAVASQFYRNGLSKLGLNCGVARRLFTHELRSMSSVCTHGNHFDSLSSGKHSCGVHSNHALCNSSCHCYHTSVSALNGLNKNNFCFGQTRMNSTQARDTSGTEQQSEEIQENTDEDESEMESENENELEAKIESENDNLFEMQEEAPREKESFSQRIISMFGGTNSKIVELEKEVNKWKEHASRSQADLMNYSDMSKREVDKATKYAVKKFSKDILNVADSLRGAMNAIESGSLDQNEAAKPLVDGVSLTQKTLLETFAKHGITLMDCEGAEFDPNFHEALFTVPTTEHPANTIVNVVEQGYMMSDRVLRSAKVGITVLPPDAAEPDANEGNENNEK